MALNVAVPFGDILEGFGLLSPISPISIDCRANLKILVSPVSSESSGVSSLDSEEIKKQTSSPSTTPTEEVDEDKPTSDVSPTTTPAPEVLLEEAVSPPPPSSSSSSASSVASETCATTETLLVFSPPLPKPQPLKKDLKILVDGRDFLDLGRNLRNSVIGHPTLVDEPQLTKPAFQLQYAKLPMNDNIHFFLDNRSQYHRLGANGQVQEYTMTKCNCCDFWYPVNNVGSSSSSSIGTIAGLNAATIIGGNSFGGQSQQQQHQHQQQQLAALTQQNVNNQYTGFNNRDRLVNTGAGGPGSAFNKMAASHGNSNANGGGLYRAMGGQNGGGNLSGFGGGANSIRESNNSARNFMQYNNSNQKGSYHQQQQQQTMLQQNNNGYGKQFNQFNNGFQMNNQPSQYYNKRYGGNSSISNNGGSTLSWGGLANVGTKSTVLANTNTSSAAAANFLLNMANFTNSYGKTNNMATYY